MNTPDLSLLAPEDVIAVYRLIEQLCERGNDPQGWRNHFTKELHRLFTAQTTISYLMKFALDPGDVGPKTLIVSNHGSNPVWDAYIARGDLTDNPATPHIMERFGTDFTCPRQEWIEDRDWYESDFFKNVATPSGWDHAIHSQVGIIRPGLVDGLGVCKKLGEPPFTPHDVAMVRLIHQELARLWRKHDPLDTHVLPPRQREVLEGIRRGESRKAIAEKMAVSDHTVHAYEKALFDRAKVSSRMELLALISKLVRPTLLP